MSAKGVRIAKALEHGDSYSDPNFLLVETARDDDGQAVSCIDHICNKPGSLGWSVKSLGAVPLLSHSDAMIWATTYAMTQGVPVIYERDETCDSMDTMVLPSVGSI